MEQERIDDEQADHGVDEDATRVGGAAEPAGEHDQPGHRRGAQHRRLPTRHRAEHREDGSPPTSRVASRRRRSTGSAIASANATLAPGHGEQVAEARGAEVVDEVRRDGAGVAEHEAGEQRTRGGREGVGAAQHHAARRVGDHEPRPVRARDGVHALHLDRGDGVAPAQPRREPREWGEPAAQPDPVTGLEHPQRALLVARDAEEHGAAARGAAVDHASTVASASVAYCGPDGSSVSVTARVTVADRPTAAVSGDTTSPWSARCSTATPSSTQRDRRDRERRGGARRAASRPPRSRSPRARAPSPPGPAHARRRPRSRRRARRGGRSGPFTPSPGR